VEFEAGPGMAGYWRESSPARSRGTDKVLPQLLPNDTIDLEGNELRVIRIGQADTAESTVLHVPSLAAVVTGDLAYNEVHMMTAETGDDHRGITAVPSDFSASWPRRPPQPRSSPAWSRFTRLGNLRTIWYSSRSAIARKDS